MTTKRTIAFPDDLFDLLNLDAKKRGESRSQYVVRAVQARLQTAPGVPSRAEVSAWVEEDEAPPQAVPCGNCAEYGRHDACSRRVGYQSISRGNDLDPAVVASWCGCPDCWGRDE